MEMPTTVYKLGRSLAVRLPSEMVDAMNLKKGMKVSIKDIEPNRIELSITR